MGLRACLRKLLHHRNDKKKVELRKAVEEAASSMFIERHTKQCPQCLANVEKEDGCDHMECICGHSFCWLCLQRWGLQHHLPECIYRGDPQTLAALVVEQPANQGLWLEGRGMAIAQGEGVLGLYFDGNGVYDEDVAQFLAAAEQWEREWLESQGMPIAEDMFDLYIDDNDVYDEDVDQIIASVKYSTAELPQTILSISCQSHKACNIEPVLSYYKVDVRKGANKVELLQALNSFAPTVSMREQQAITGWLQANNATLADLASQITAARTSTGSNDNTESNGRAAKLSTGNTVHDPQGKECPVCVETLTEESFPNGKITSSCLHEPTFCKGCL
ncbi:hypothetical protein IFR05_005222 [Cadophora sp. M221]|nr:hypothetical protein IFR05_005222 [Cadophora sp. M221]